MTESIFYNNYLKFHGSGELIKHPEVDVSGLCAVSLEMKRDEVILANGTGFLWAMQNGITALVTAWHNLSGLHHTTRECLHSMGGIPNRITVRLMMIEPRNFLVQNINLYLDEKECQPRWLVHKEYGSFLDFCFLPVKFPGLVPCVNDIFKVDETKLEPGHDVFAVGFPNKVSVAAVFPVWKRGSIASDVAIPIEGHPKYLIDMTGRSGMSGSPVYRIQKGGFYEGDAKDGRFLIGTKREFIGIYTGRAVGFGKESSELGFVWRSAFVKQMLQNPTLDEKPEPGKGVWKHEDKLTSL